MGKVIIALGGAGGIDPDECTAGRAQVLEGYTAGVHGEDEPAKGSMPERGDWNGSVGMNAKVAIPDGHHGGGGTVKGPDVTQRGAWSGSVGMNGEVGVPEGYHDGAGKVKGPAVAQRGAWSGNVGMNGNVGIPEGYHNGGGKVYGPAVTQRGSLDKQLAINETFSLPEGYYSGGQVRQSIPVQGADVSGTDRAGATGANAWEQTMCLGVRNGHYLNGVNWIQASLPGFQSGNIRQGVSIGGLVGKMADYSYLAAGQTSFNMGAYSGVLADGFWQLGSPIQQFEDGSAMLGGWKSVSASYLTFGKKSIHLGPFSKIRVEYAVKINRSATYSWAEFIYGFLPKTCIVEEPYRASIIDSGTGGSPSWTPYTDHWDSWAKNQVFTLEINIPSEYRNDFWFFGMQACIGTSNWKNDWMAVRKIEFLN